MNTAFLLVLVLCVLVWLMGRRVPLVGWRRRGAIGARLVTLAALAVALSGAACHRLEPRPSALVYLVDDSASLSDAQRAWIARRLASLEARRPATLPRAVLAFGATTRLVSPLSQARWTDPAALRRAIASAPLAREQTNLETALLSVPASLPSQARAGVVLLTDGQETAGHVSSVLLSVRRLGLRVFPAPPPPDATARATWEELNAPSIVQQGAPIPLELVVANAAPRATRGTIVVTWQGVTLKRQAVTIRPGWHVLTVSVPSVVRGPMAMEVTLELPEAGVQERRRAYTEVVGPPRLVWVSEQTTELPPLAMALKRRQMDLVPLRRSELPADVGALLDADAVLLFNVPKSALVAAQVTALDAYVKQRGGGLVVVGLGGELAEETTHPAPLDALLPLTFEPKGLQESKRRVCIVLLIDRSASMIGPRIAATKRAAVALVKQLLPEDLVGVLAFDVQPYVVAEVQPAGQVSDWLVEKLVKLRSSGGTDALPALTAAANRLDMTGATVKHIILLSDGNTPFMEQPYRALIQSLRQSRTTVSTIGVGAAFINVDYLNWLAKSTGGTFYQLRDLNALPTLVTRDAERTLEQLPFAEGRFQPAKTPTTDWFADTPAFPALKGYFTATAKPEARVDLVVEHGPAPEPLLARWALGRGRVVAFASDAHTRWSPEWIRWPGFEATWAQIVRWAMRPQLSEELFVWVEDRADTLQLVIEGDLHEPAGTLAAAEDPTAAQPLAFIQTGPWRWQASLESVPGGWYQFTLESHLPAPSEARQAGLPAAPGSPDVVGPSVFTKRWIQVGTPRSLQEVQGQPPREPLLRQVARATDGAYDEPDQALLPSSETVPVTVPLLPWWIGVAIVALLLDIALRGSTML